MKSVQLPDYAANQMLSTPSHPFDKNGGVEQSLKRKYCLVADALQGLDNVQWRINDEPQMQSKMLDEFLGLERFENGFCVYSSERGFLQVLAIFKSVHLAADYFVWKVSSGQRVIDWTKFLEMEP
jgi:hypothetical protein